jgi:hypothetical protein
MTTHSFKDRKMRATALGLLFTFLVAIVATMSFRLGINESIARNAYVQTIPIREESECLATQDVECLRAHWRMRAAIVAATANHSLSNILPTSVDMELREYLGWASTQEGIQVSAGRQ